MSEEGAEEQMTCMNCGKKIDQLREAPSGSMIPRCEECNDKRWKEFYGSETEQQGAVSFGVHVVNSEDYEEDIDGEDDSFNDDY